MEAISLKGTADAGGSATTLSKATLVYCSNGHASTPTVLTLDGSVTNGSGNSGTLSLPAGQVVLIRKGPNDTIAATNGTPLLSAVSYNSNSMGTYEA
jgi:hypothetical protein